MFLSQCYKQFLELWFPPGVDLLTLRQADPTLVQNKTLTPRANFSYLLPYNLPATKAAIHLAKYHHHQEAINYLAAALATSPYFTEPTLCLPVPLASARLRERGYNQVQVLLETAARQNSHIILEPRLLQRNRHTVAQTTLNRSARLTNVQDAFTARPFPHWLPHHTKIALIDDVVTTGATLKAARAALAAVTDKPIDCIAVAH